MKTNKWFPASGWRAEGKTSISCQAEDAWASIREAQVVAGYTTSTAAHIWSDLVFLWSGIQAPIVVASGVSHD